MNQYVTGAVIKRLREQKKLTQSELATKLSVSDKTISKWENGRGYPDIVLLEPLSSALGISTIELLSGNDIINNNRSGNLSRSPIYVCPLCGNVIYSIGEAVISCCGISLPPLDPENLDEQHTLCIEPIENELFVHLPHEMLKSHYISFIACVSADRFQLVKLYPEGDASAYFKRSGAQFLYFYCNRDGLFRQKISLAR